MFRSTIKNIYSYFSLQNSNETEKLEETLLISENIIDSDDDFSAPESITSGSDTKDQNVIEQIIIDSDDYLQGLDLKIKEEQYKKTNKFLMLSNDAINNIYLFLEVKDILRLHATHPFIKEEEVNWDILTLRDFNFNINKISKSKIEKDLKKIKDSDFNFAPDNIEEIKILDINYDGLKDKYAQSSAKLIANSNGARKFSMIGNIATALEALAPQTGYFFILNQMLRFTRIGSHSYIVTHIPSLYYNGVVAGMLYFENQSADNNKQIIEKSISEIDELCSELNIFHQDIKCSKLNILSFYETLEKSYNEKSNNFDCEEIYKGLYCINNKDRKHQLNKFKP